MKNLYMTAAVLWAAILLLICVPAYGSEKQKVTGSTSVVNHIETGDVNIDLTEYEIKDETEQLYQGPKEVLPGDLISKIPRITCLGEECLVRCRVLFPPMEGELPGLSEKNIGGIPEEWVRRGDYYYLTRTLKKGESADLMTSVNIPADWNNEYQGRRVTMEIIAEAVQAANFQPDMEAEDPWGGQEIQACIHETDNTSRLFSSNVQLLVTLSEAAGRLAAVPGDFFENFGKMMPGDRFSDQIFISNKTDREAELFFSTSYEDLTDLQKDLLDQITLSVEYGGKMLYKGTLAAEKLQKEISLGKIQPGEQGVMTFVLEMPAKLDNAYAVRDAVVRWNFRTEQDVPAGTSGGYGGSAAEYGGSYEKTGVKTGDDSMAELYILLGAAAMTAVVLTFWGKKRRRQP